MEKKYLRSKTNGQTAQIRKGAVQILLNEHHTRILTLFLRLNAKTYTLTSQPSVQMDTCIGDGEGPIGCTNTGNDSSLLSVVFSMDYCYNALTHILHVLVPWTRDDFVWQEVPGWLALKQENFTSFLVRNLDADRDGYISRSELQNLSAMPTMAMNQSQNTSNQIWLRCFFPFLDWKVGLFIWRACGGLLLLIAIASIVPGKSQYWSGRIFRWPVLVFTYLMIMSELTIYIIVRLFIRCVELMFASTKHQALRNELMKAKSYDEWLSTAKQLDSSMGRDKWRETTNDNSSYRYNWDFINKAISDLRDVRENNDAMSAFFVLGQCIRKNVGGVMSEDMFYETYTGEPKIAVSEFLKEVACTLKWLTEEIALPLTDDSDDCMNTMEQETCHDNSKKEGGEDGNVMNLVGHVIGSGVGWAIRTVSGDHGADDTTCKTLPQSLNQSSNEKVSAESRQTEDQLKFFLKRAKAAYGRTALCLSGGAMMGCYHFGHVKALLEEDTLPRIISGTSAGSIIAALVCTRTDEELRRDLQPEILVDKTTCFSKTWPERLRSLYENGFMFDKEEWIDLLSWFTCNLTFEEAYKKTGRILCIALSSTTKKAPPVLANYITAPDVTIASAIVASAAVPGLIKPVVLSKKGPDGKIFIPHENKDEAYYDGSIAQDIPKEALAEMFNVQFFLTAQCNPHIVPFFFSSKGCVAQPSRWSRGLSQDSWRGGFLLSALELYLKSDMKAKMIFLDELEAAVGFTSTLMTQIYHGSTTIVPQISILDYLVLIENPSLPFLKKCFQNGSVAAYEHCALMKHHYIIARAIDECLDILENKGECSNNVPSKELEGKKIMENWQRSSILLAEIE